MSSKNAPDYGSFRARLSQIFTETLRVPSVRELKAACGGAGSLATYHEYRQRWMEEQRKGSEAYAILLAIEAERNAHDSVMSAHLDRLKQHLRLYPPSETAADEEDDPVEEAEAEAEPKMTRESSRDVDEAFDRAGVDDGEELGRASDTMPLERIRAIAERCVTRFCDDEDEAAANASRSSLLKEDGPASPDRSAPAPTGLYANTDDEVPLSRSVGGSQQVAHPHGTNQPLVGESGSFGEGEHGYA